MLYNKKFCDILTLRSLATYQIHLGSSLFTWEIFSEQDLKETAAAYFFSYKHSLVYFEFDWKIWIWPKCSLLLNLFVNIASCFVVKYAFFAIFRPQKRVVMTQVRCIFLRIQNILRTMVLIFYIFFVSIFSNDYSKLLFYHRTYFLYCKSESNVH